MMANRYKWLLNESVTPPFFQLVFVSGTDVMNLANRPVVYEGTKFNNCRCDSKYQLATADFLLNTSGLLCTTCLKPVGTASCCDNCFTLSLPDLTQTVADVTSTIFDSYTAFIKTVVDACDLTYSTTQGGTTETILVSESAGTVTITIDPGSGTTYTAVYTITGSSSSSSSSSGVKAEGFNCDLMTLHLNQRYSTTGGVQTPDSTVNWPSTITLIGVPCESSSSRSSSSSVSSSSGSSSSSSGSSSSGSSSSNPCGGGGCLWTWNGTSWDLTSNGCFGGCICVAPDFAGIVVGQQANTGCQAV